MKRAVWLLLLALLAWLPASALARAVEQAPAPSVVQARDGRPQLSLPASTASSAQVARAPLQERLPFELWAAPALEREPWLRGAGLAAPDLRDELERVQTRRRLPRLNDEDPPWC